MSYPIDPRLPLTSEVRRIAVEEIEGALGHLAAARDDPDTALHECRKRLKSLRALLRLVRSGDEAFAQAENARYRDASAGLAGPREATALIETVDRLAEAFPDETADGTLSPVRDRLVARYDSVLDGNLAKAVDGGCRLLPGWLAAGRKILSARPAGKGGRHSCRWRPAGPCAGHAKPCRRRRRVANKTISTICAKRSRLIRNICLCMKRLWPSPVKARARRSMRSPKSSASCMTSSFCARCFATRRNARQPGRNAIA